MTRQVHNVNLRLLKMILYRSIRDQGIEDFILLVTELQISMCLSSLQETALFRGTDLSTITGKQNLLGTRTLRAL